MNFSHACQNFLAQVVFYEAVQLYERYGLSPELNKPSVKKHFKDFGVSVGSCGEKEEEQVGAQRRGKGHAEILLDEIRKR